MINERDLYAIHGLRLYITLFIHTQALSAKNQHKLRRIQMNRTKRRHEISRQSMDNYSEFFLFALCHRISVLAFICVSAPVGWL